MHSEQIIANIFIQCASSTRWSPECTMYMCYYVILSPSPPPRCPSGYFGPRCLQPEPLRLRMPKPSESMLTWEAQLHTEDRSPAVTTSVALLSCVPDVLTVGRFGLCGSRCCSCSNFMFSLLSSLFLSFFCSSSCCISPLFMLYSFFLSFFSFLWFCFLPSGVQMTLLVIAVKPTLWPVSTVCPFLLLSVSAACWSCCVMSSLLLSNSGCSATCSNRLSQLCYPIQWPIDSPCITFYWWIFPCKKINYHYYHIVS